MIIELQANGIHDSQNFNETLGLVALLQDNP